MTSTVSRRKQLLQIKNARFFTSLIEAFEAGDPHADSKDLERSNVECLQLMYHAIARREFDTVVTMCAEDILFEILGPPHVPFVGRCQGREELLVALHENFSTLEDQDPQIETLTAQGNSVIVIANEIGRISATGSQYEVNWVQCFTFEDGLLRQIREIIDSGADFPVA